jgi:hypothetical protein
MPLTSSLPTSPGQPDRSDGSVAAGRGHAPRTPVHSVTAGSDREPPFCTVAVAVTTID